MNSVAGLALALHLGNVYAQDVLQENDTARQGRTIIGEQPWDPSVLENATASKVIYGTDNRIDVYEETDPARLAQAAATCGLISAGSLTFNAGTNSYTIATSAYTIAGKPACSGEPYGSQPTAMFCTGFLVSHDIIATAGHCFDSSDLSGTRFVFGFKMQNSTTAVINVPASHVYQGIEILGRQLVGQLDYAVIRVDRSVTAPGALPLPIRRTGTIDLNAPVGVIGHPSGLPMKIAFGSTTAVHENGSSGFFTANLDTYGGNSGSPVFNQSTGVVEGILVRGAADFDVGSTCFTSNVLPDSPGQEDVSRSTTFASFVPEDTDPLPQNIVTDPVDAVSFGTVETGQSVDRTVTISNSGDQALLVSNIAITNAAFSLVSGGPAPFTVLPGAPATLTLRFAPTVAGNISGTLDISSNDPDQPVVSLPLSGAGSAPIVLAPDIQLSPRSLDFGIVNIGTTGEMALRIANPGNATLTISGLTGLEGTQFSHTASLPLQIPEGGATNVTMRFSPTFQGAAAARLMVNSDDPDQPSLQCALLGTARCAIDGLATGETRIDLAPAVLGARKIKKNISISVDVRQAIGPSSTENAEAVPPTQVSAIVVPADYNICNVGELPVMTLDVSAGRAPRPGRQPQSRRIKLNIPRASVPAGSRILVVVDPANQYTEHDERNNFVLTQPFP